MPAYPERTPQERETLIFPDAEGAQKFRERVGEQLPRVEGVEEKRQIIREEVATQFASHGESVVVVKQPWEHTSAEHEEAQALADAAFAEDLGVAIRQAKKSPHYPRNLDLLHDLLTGELYQYVKEGRINRQPLTFWLVEVAVIVLVAALAVLLLLVSI